MSKKIKRAWVVCGPESSGSVFIARAISYAVIQGKLLRKNTHRISSALGTSLGNDYAILCKNQ